MIYNKLVRDKIPEIIKENGSVPEYSVLNQKEYQIELKNKLKEEVAEFLESEKVEELADILEVVLALAKSLNVSKEKLEKIRQEKAEKRGTFKERIFLKNTKD